MQRGERALEESQWLLQTVIDSVPHAIYGKDTSDNYVLGNRTFMDLLGMEPEDLGDLTTEKLPGLTEQARAAILREDRRVIETGEQVVNPSLAIRSRDRPAMIRQVHKTPLLDRENRVAGIIAISEDITERKQAEEALLLRQGRRAGVVGFPGKCGSA